MEQKPQRFKKFKLASSILKGAHVKGYKTATPIQTKSIPAILRGRDLIATSRTGSGKTAAFVLPILHQLNSHSIERGPRSLLIAPTRELALQIHTELIQLGKYTDLHACLLVGGESFEEQFYALRNHPDVIVATPGRLFHILNETDFRLDDLRHVVFDEADRLFEMGFASQINFILSKLPRNRQTLMFSATLPPVLADFSKAALRDPDLAKISSENILSDNLQNVFLSVNSDEKPGALLALLKEKILPKNQQSLVFCSTRHAVELLQRFLSTNDISCGICYGKIDQTTRKTNLAEFTKKSSNVLLVTDIAARGLDIPRLDCVINYNFPADVRLFIHRVGRVARLDSNGKSISLISPDERPFFVEIAAHLGIDFLSKSPLMFGCFPRDLIDHYAEYFSKSIQRDVELIKLFRSHQNAEKLYQKTRQSASKRSVIRSKLIISDEIHPEFSTTKNNFSVEIGIESKELLSFKRALKSVKLQKTIFEIDENPSKKSTKLNKLKLLTELKRRRKVIKKEKKFVEEKGIMSSSMKLDELVKLSKDYRDKKNYISVEKRFNDFRMDLNEDGVKENSGDGLKRDGLMSSSGENFNLIGVRDFVDLEPDEIEDLNKKRYKKWNAKRRKFQLVTEIDGKILKKTAKLCKTTKTNSNLQKMWTKSKTSAVKKSTIDRWGSARHHKYVKRVIFEKTEKGVNNDKNRSSSNRRRISSNNKPRRRKPSNNFNKRLSTKNNRKRR